MTKADAHLVTREDKQTKLFALAVLLVLAALALVGPGGLLAWGDNLAQLSQRNAEIARLTAERDELRNRVALLDPDHVDPDLAAELIRRNLNVIRPDEVVIPLD